MPTTAASRPTHQAKVSCGYRTRRGTERIQPLSQGVKEYRDEQLISDMTKGKDPKKVRIVLE